MLGVDVGPGDSVPASLANDGVVVGLGFDPSHAVKHVRNVAARTTAFAIGTV